jgi:hypothetical protein
LFEKLLPFLLFVIVGSFTPGPNNMISTASGAAFGFVRTIPQMLGVSIGYPLMLVAFGFGLGEVLRHAPWLHEALRYAGTAFLLYLAWRIANAATMERAEANRPLTLFEAALFQWLNPKAWALALWRARGGRVLQTARHSDRTPPHPRCRRFPPSKCGSGLRHRNGCSERQPFAAWRLPHSRNRPAA